VVYIVVSSPPATEETGAMDHKIESRQGNRVVAFKKKKYVIIMHRLPGF
jgi:hypothetical protein